MKLGGHFDLPNKEKRIKELETLIQEENFWSDVNNASKINQELINLQKEIKESQRLYEEIKESKEYLEIINDEESLNDLVSNLNKINQDLENLENNTLLNGKYDSLNCFLEIHPGAGGTESCDWANMLLRMYKRFCEKQSFRYETIEEQFGDEAGIKSVTLRICGLNAYGYLKNEQGVHRLVRISPFDSNKRRHTSFASVNVIPEFDNKIEIEIKESDLKIDVYHSSGAGGQSVNTSNSAVRITHIPTKIVVTCQVERSQLKNKETAMRMLKSKLYQKELEKQNNQIESIKGEQTSINFGNQIRSYVLEPYTIVKDYRSNYETSQVDKVLDGDLSEIITSILKEKRRGQREI